MCVPLVAGVAIAGLVLAAAGTATSVVAAQQQQEAQNKAMAYNADLQKRNAEIAKMEGDTARQEGQVAVNQHDLAVKGLIATERTAQAGSGLLTDTGSNLNITQDTAGFGKLDSLTIQSNAARTAWGLDNQAAGFSASANLLGASKGSTALAATSPLLSGTSNLTKQLYGDANSGAFSSSPPPSIKATAASF